MSALLSGSLASVAIGLGVGLRLRLKWLVGAVVAVVLIAMVQLAFDPSAAWIFPLLSVGGFMAAIAAGSWFSERSR